jgi:hypothetical protein
MQYMAYSTRGLQPGQACPARLVHSFLHTALHQRLLYQKQVRKKNISL